MPVVEDFVHKTDAVVRLGQGSVTKTVLKVKISITSKTSKTSKISKTSKTSSAMAANTSPRTSIFVLYQIILLLTVFFPLSSEQKVTTLLELSHHSKLIYHLRHVLPVSPELSSLGAHCAASMHSLVDIVSPKEWTLAMLDANAALPATMQSNMMTSVGGFGQCLAIKNTDDPLNWVYGQYCLLQLKLVPSTTNLTTSVVVDKFLHNMSYINRRYPLTLGLCAPHSCSPHELSHLFEQYFSATSPGGFKIDSIVQHCQHSAHQFGKHRTLKTVLEEHNLLIVFPILVCSIILVVVGTVLDMARPRDDHHPSSGPSFTSILLSFSALRNTKVLFGHRGGPADHDHKQPSMEQRFSFLHGLRALFIFWIVGAHCCSLMPASNVMSFSLVSRFPFDVFAMLQANPIWTNVFNNGTLAVEGFFLMSGLLFTSLMIAKNMQRRAHFTTYFLFRWTRLAMPLLGLIVLNKSITMFGSGPFFAHSSLASVQQGCDDGVWWRNLLLLHNWTDLSTTCVPWSWFICVEFQIHVIAFVVVLLLKHNRVRLSLMFSLGMIITSLALPLVFVLNGLETFSNFELIGRIDKSFDFKNYILLYSGTHVHMAAYFFGALLGQCLAYDRKMFVGRYTRPLAWWWSVVAVLVLPFVDVPEAHGHYYGHVAKAVAIGLTHGLWVLSLGVLFYFLSNVEDYHSYGHSVKCFLSSTLFEPFGRLSFSMYMTHMTMIWYNLYTSMAPTEMNNIHMTLFLCGIYLETIISGFVLFILFECPAINLIKVFVVLPKALEQSFLKNNNNLDKQMEQSSRLRPLEHTKLVMSAEEDKAHTKL